MSSNDVAVRGPSSALAIADGQTGFTDQQVAALRHLGAEEAGEGDLAVFFHQAARTGLDPFAKQIYLIGRNAKAKVWEDSPNGGRRQVERWVTKYTIQTGIDGFRLIADRAARRHRETLGYEETLWCGDDGKWRETWSGDRPPVAAKVVVLRNSNRFPAIAHFSEYAQTTSQGGLTSMWARMPAGQLAKCAEALALRKAFPQDLSGIYTDEEMGQADSRAAEEAARAAAVPPPRAGQRVIDGETAPAAPSIPVDQPDSTGRDCAAWQATIAALATLDEARKLWRESGKEVLDRDCDGTPLFRRIEARMVELRDAEQAAAAAAAPAADADDDGPVDVPEGVGEPMDSADGDGTMAAPLEGEVLDAPADSATPAATVSPDPEDLRRNTPQRRATLQELTRLFRGGEAMAAACEQVFGLAPDDVATNRLRRWMTELQREGSGQ